VCRFEAAPPPIISWIKKSSDLVQWNVCPLSHMRHLHTSIVNFFWSWKITHIKCFSILDMFLSKCCFPASFDWNGWSWPQYCQSYYFWEKCSESNVMFCGMCSGSNLPVRVININLQNVATYRSSVNGVPAVEVIEWGRKPSFMVANLWTVFCSC